MSMPTTKTTFEAFLYGWTNRATRRKYAGVHKGIPDDKYFFSSKDPVLISDHQDDMLERVIIARGTYEEMINLEYQLLTQVNAKNNKDWYNKSNGGGKGLSKDFVTDRQIALRISDFINDLLVEDEDDVEYVSGLNAEMMKVLAQAVKNGEYRKNKIGVHQLYILDKNQVRAVELNQEHVNNLADDFSDPEYVRMYLTPVIVLVDKHGRMIKLLDGNHRVHAAHKAGLKTIPVIFLEESLFEFSEDNQEFFGTLMNHRPIHTLGNNQDDLIKTINNYHQKFFPNLEVNSEEFKNAFKSVYGGKGSKKQGVYRNADINSKCDLIAEKQEDILLLNGKNFISYTSSRLNNLWKHYKNKDKNPIVVQTIEGIQNSGVGGIQKLIFEAEAKSGTVICHFSTYKSYLDRSVIINNFLKQVEYTSKVKINLIFADPHEEKLVTKL